MSTAATIASMGRLAHADQAHPSVIEFAADVDQRAQRAANSAGRPATTVDRLDALERAIRERVAYVPDPVEHELIRYPSVLLTAEPQGDCDDMITLAKAVTLAWGLHSKLMRLGFRTDRRDPYSHVVLWVSAEDAGAPGDVVLDPTVAPEQLAALLAGVQVADLT